MKLANFGQNTNPNKKAANKGVIQLDTETVVKTKVKIKRPSKGMRKHNRAVKQEARRVSIPGMEVKKKKRPAAKTA